MWFIQVKLFVPDVMLNTNSLMEPVLKFLLQKTALQKMEMEIVLLVKIIKFSMLLQVLALTTIVQLSQDVINTVVSIPLPVFVGNVMMIML